MNTEPRFSGKTAVVSGAASGIGKAVAERLAAEGAFVIVTDRNVEDGRKVTASLGSLAEFAELDVTDPAAWQCVAESTRAREGVDVLINAAGILRAIDLENDDVSIFARVIEVNVTGTMLGCRVMTPKMRGRGDAAIVNLGSVSAYTGAWNLIAYDASKGAVRNLTKELAIYYARRGDRIRCNVVHPGLVQTSMVEQFFTDNSAEQAAWIQSQPNGRVGRPEEIANLIVFLASSDARFMTGGDYLVNGGSLT